MNKHIKKICEKNNLEYLASANKSKVKKQWGIDLPVDKTNRKIDFIIKKDRQLFLCEVNFYSVGGSKLKSTAGEYKNIYNFWKSHNLQFIWITDGIGWHTAKRNLQETFEVLHHLYSLNDLINGTFNLIFSKDR